MADRSAWFSVLKYTVIGVGTIVAALVLMGVTYSEESHTFEVTVNKPSYKCFQIFTDPVSLPLWVDGVKDMKLIEGVIDKPGCKMLLIMEVNGKRMEMTETLVNYEENALYAFDYENDMMRGNLETKFLSENNMTRIVVTNRYSGASIFKNVALHFMAPVILETQEQQYIRLKQLIEDSKW